MSVIRHSEGRLVVGVDLGGTQIRVLALANGRPCGRYQGPTTDEARLGNLLRRLWKRQQWSARNVAALVVAAKGIWTDGERRALAQRLNGLARRVVVVPDAQAALLGALDGRAGVLILAGTGSIAVGRDGRGHWTRAGGLGPLLGDEGSGFWLGREWLRTTSRGDDILPALALLRSRNPVGRIAALAPGVIRRARRGNRDAKRIVTSGQASLAAHIEDIARRLRLASPVLVSWAGSVLGDEWYRAGVGRALARAGLCARWVEPASPPVAAAARLAEHLVRGRVGKNSPPTRKNSRWSHAVPNARRPRCEPGSRPSLK